MRHRDNGIKHRRLPFKIFLGVVCSLIPISLFSQEIEKPIKIGIGAGLGSNISRTYIEAYQGNYLCGVFQKGSAPGSSFFGQLEIPIAHSVFSIMPRIGYADLSSNFATTAFTIPRAFDTSVHSPVPINRERDYSTNVKSISLDALVAWQPFTFPLHIALGGGAAWFVHHTFTESEKLLSNAVYIENNLSTRTISSGTFDTKTFAATAQFAAGYDFYFLPGVTISPEVRTSVTLSPVSATYGTYRTYTIDGAIALMYTLPTGAVQEENIPPIEIPKPQPVAEIKKETPPKNILRLSVKAVGVTEAGEEVPEPVVAIENIRVTDVAPTLNYVFFDDGSSEIPGRYHLYSNETSAKNFNPSSLYKTNALGIHYDVLNILGLRMQQSPNSKITITGTRSLHSSGDSAAASDISLLRAENAAKYLQNVWGIAPSRIRIKSRSLPEQPSDENAATGQAENRRIEITTNTPSLLEPLETHKLERTATPPKISFQSDITSNYSNLKSQIITIKQGDRIIKKIDGLSPEANGELLWNIGEASAIETDKPVIWKMEITDSSDTKAVAEGAIHFKKQETSRSIYGEDTVADKSLERFHLLLFDYSSSAELNSVSDEIFDRIAHAITPDSRVSLIGHTDITGDPNFNEHLSYDRASRASQLLSSRLKKLGISAPSFNLEARGAKDILFDNSNAEGRFLSRTVRISIERDLHQ